jgi:hypothetical protein
MKDDFSVVFNLISQIYDLVKQTAKSFFELLLAT